jgi:hypothetical protein
MSSVVSAIFQRASATLPSPAKHSLSQRDNAAQMQGDQRKHFFGNP